VYDLEVVWAEKSAAKNEYKLTYLNGAEVDGSKAYPLAEGLMLTCEFVAVNNDGTSADGMGTMPPEIAGYTQEDMRENFKEFKDVVDANWDEWTTRPDDLRWVSITSWLKGAGPDMFQENYFVSYSLEQYRETYSLNYEEDKSIITPENYFINLFLAYARFIDPIRYGFHNADWLRENIVLGFIKGEGSNGYNEYLNNLVLDYSEYVIAFWEATGLVYSPLEDIFYIQAGIPYMENAAPPEPLEVSESEVVGDADSNFDIFEGMTKDEREELQDFINESFASLDEPGPEADDNSGLYVYLISGIALLIITAIIISFVVHRKKRNFMSDPPK
jgi:hypothetical protein